MLIVGLTSRGTTPPKTNEWLAGKSTIWVCRCDFTIKNGKFSISCLFSGGCNQADFGGKKGICFFSFLTHLIIIWVLAWLLEILLMEEVLHQLIWQISHYWRGFLHPRWCRISSNSIIRITINESVEWNAIGVWALRIFQSKVYKTPTCNHTDGAFMKDFIVVY